MPRLSTAPHADAEIATAGHLATAKGNSAMLAAIMLPVAVLEQVPDTQRDAELILSYDSIRR
jgi:hypothetical protein